MEPNVFAQPQMLESLIALIAGVLILLMPGLLNRVVALYFIIVGGLGFFKSGAYSPLLLRHVVAVAAGIAILAVPRLLNYIVAMALILIGLLGLLH